MHVCWGNYQASNPRHPHEWVVWKSARVPENKALIFRGLLTSTSNYVEHPELVARRSLRNGCGRAKTGAGLTGFGGGGTWGFGLACGR